MEVISCIDTFYRSSHCKETQGPEEGFKVFIDQQC